MLPLQPKRKSPLLSESEAITKVIKILVGLLLSCYRAGGGQAVLTPLSLRFARNGPDLQWLLGTGDNCVSAKAFAMTARASPALQQQSKCSFEQSSQSQARSNWPLERLSGTNALYINMRCTQHVLHIKQASRWAWACCTLSASVVMALWTSFRVSAQCGSFVPVTVAPNSRIFATASFNSAKITSYFHPLRALLLLTCLQIQKFKCF